MLFEDGEEKGGENGPGEHGRQEIPSEDAEVTASVLC